MTLIATGSNLDAYGVLLICPNLLMGKIQILVGLRSQTNTGQIIGSDLPVKVEDPAWDIAQEFQRAKGSMNTLAGPTPQL